jgi:hypothetical protein
VGLRKLPEIAELNLDDQALADNVPQLLGELVAILEAGNGAQRTRLDRSSEHGRIRRDQGFTLPLLIAEHGILRRLILSVVQENLLALDVSNVISDILEIEDAGERQLRQAVEAFISSEKIAA